jgi:hypothetical protein
MERGHQTITNRIVTTLSSSPKLLSSVHPQFLSILPNLSSSSPISCNPATKYPITCNTLLGLLTQTWLANDRKSTQRVEEEGQLTSSCRRGGLHRCPCIQSSIPRRSRPDKRPKISHRRSPSSPHAGRGGAWLNLPLPPWPKPSAKPRPESPPHRREGCEPYKDFGDQQKWGAADGEGERGFW